jgi:hypothetical protein
MAARDQDSPQAGACWHSIARWLLQHLREKIGLRKSSTPGVDKRQHNNLDNYEVLLGMTRYRATHS